MARVQHLIFAAISLILMRVPVAFSAPLHVGEVAFQSALATSADLAGSVAGGDGSAEVIDGSLRVTSAKTGQVVRFPLPVDTLRGARIVLSARIKAENVKAPPHPWNGVKVMIQTDSPSGPTYASPIELNGTFDWRMASVTAYIPRDATAANIVLGVEDTTGQAWFNDVVVKITGVPRNIPSPRPTTLPAALDRRIDIPHLRGVMYGPNGKAEDIRKLAEWHANLIRWQFYDYAASQPAKRLDLAAYDRWLDETIAQVDTQLLLCESLGIHVVIDLHTPPGGGTRDRWEIFNDAKYQAHFIEVWDKLANHFKDKPAVWAYDLVNEPVEDSVAPDLLDWRNLAEKVARRVRVIDPKHAIIIEPGPSGGWANLDYFEPIAVPGIIYSVHMYEPLNFTHQGVLAGSPRGPVYPGKIDGALWDRQKILQTLEPVRRYQLDYGVPIFIGEFSAIRWANGSADYIRDCISVFEEFGWDWSYHAFREWQGWNVEIENGSPSDKPKPATQPTDRLQVLRAGFAG